MAWAGASGGRSWHNGRLPASKGGLANRHWIIGEDRLWGWQIVGPSVRSMSPHTLLHWDSIKWSRERDLAYDMGGVPSDGVRIIGD